MSRKRPFEEVAPEPEAPRSPRKRLQVTVLVRMWLGRCRGRSRARGVTAEHQLIRQMQVEIAKLFMLLMVFVVRLGSMERLLLDLPNALQRSLEEQFSAFQRSLMGSIGDTVRVSVQTEMQKQQSTSLSDGVYQPPRQNISEGFAETGGFTRMVKLSFVDVDRPKDPLYTGLSVQWQNGAKAKIAIFENGSQITDGDLSKLQIEILPVRDDFFTERGQSDFTKEEFNKQIYTESVLITVNLSNGEANLGPFFFTESSYRKKLRLAARVKRQDLLVRVQEAITSSFVVKDRRSKSNQKSYPPSKNEGIHCLEKISPNGKHWIGLMSKNITEVKHLMRHYHMDKSSLQKLTGMKKEDWHTMIEHASTSDPGDEIYSYRAAEEDTVLFFNDFFDLVGMRVKGVYAPYRVHDHNNIQQLKVDNWKASAHKKFEELEGQGSLIPDYVMDNKINNGLPVHIVSVFPNNNASPSIQAIGRSQYSDAQTAHEGLGQLHPSIQQNIFPLAQVSPNNDAGPSIQGGVPLQQFAARSLDNKGAAEFCQRDPCMPQMGTSYYQAHESVNVQSSFSAQASIPSHDILPVPEDDLIPAGASAYLNGYLSSSIIDAAGTSFPITDEGVGASSDGVGQRTSSLDYDQTIFNVLSPMAWLEPNYGHVADQGFLLANDDLVDADDGNGDDFHNL